METSRWYPKSDAFALDMTCFDGQPRKWLTATAPTAKMRQMPHPPRRFCVPRIRSLFLQSMLFWACTRGQAMEARAVPALAPLDLVVVPTR